MGSEGCQSNRKFRNEATSLYPVRRTVPVYAVTLSSKITVKSHIYVKSAFIRTLLSLRAFGSGGMYSPVKVLLHGNNRTQVVMD